VRFGDPNHSRIVGELGAAFIEAGTEVRVGVVGEAGIDGKNVILCRFDQEQRLKFLKLLRVLRSYILRLAEVGGDVVKLLWEIVRVGLVAVNFPWWTKWSRARHPAVVIEPAVVGDLKILGLMSRRSLRIVECVDETDVVHGLLRD